MIKWDFTVDKPIAMICHGHSLKEFIARWNELRELDFIWCSLNHADFLNNILGQPLDLYIHFTKNPCRRPEYKRLLVKAHARGNSLLEFIYQCGENDVKDLVVFGADGYADKEQPYFYPGHPPLIKSAHIRETTYFNGNFPTDIKTNVYNVNPDSKYEGMKKITYEELFNTFPNKRADLQVS